MSLLQKLLITAVLLIAVSVVTACSGEQEVTSDAKSKVTDEDTFKIFRTDVT